MNKKNQALRCLSCIQFETIKQLEEFEIFIYFREQLKKSIYLYVALKMKSASWNA